MNCSPNNDKKLVQYAKALAYSVLLVWSSPADQLGTDFTHPGMKKNIYNSEGALVKWRWWDRIPKRMR